MKYESYKVQPKPIHLTQANLERVRVNAINS